MRKIVVFLAAILAVAALLGGCKRGEDSPKELTLGFVPFVEGDKLMEEIKPLTDALGEKMGIPVKGFIATKYIGMVEGLGAGQIDLCFLPPTAYVLAHKEAGAQLVYVALGKSGKPFYESQILVRKDSGIKDVEGLKGKKFAFVDASSTSGYLYPYVYLKDHGIDPEKDLASYVFSEGHDKSIDLLMKGDVDGASTFVDARERFRKDFPTAMEDLVVLTKTDPIPNISAVVRKGLSEEIAASFRKALKEISEDEKGKELLSGLFNIYGFAEADDAQFDPVRRVMEELGVGADQ